MGALSFPELCSLLIQPTTKSIAANLWLIAGALWSWQGLFVICAFGAWIVIELITKNGTFHYNSENGFSPLFNSVIGSGTYLGLQTLLFVVLRFLFGDGVYCVPVPYVIHVAIFFSTGWLLNVIGFWKYQKEPGSRGRKRYRKK